MACVGSNVTVPVEDGVGVVTIEKVSVCLFKLTETCEDTDGCTLCAVTMLL